MKHETLYSEKSFLKSGESVNPENRGSDRRNEINPEANTPVASQKQETTMNKSKFTLFTAGFALATALTFSCSSNDGDENEGDSSSSVVVESSSSADNICGSETYNPAEEFCNENIIFELCGSETYNPETEFCSENIVYELCDGDEYDTEEEFCDVRDNKLYKFVKIGTQTWMAENLNYETASGSWCYDDNADYCTTYGRLYDWETAMDGVASSTANPSGVQGVCPSDWHLPSRDEWEVLVTYAGGTSTAGTKLKATSGWGTGTNNGTDDYGFSALPGGNRDTDGSFGLVGTYSYWWGATEFSGNIAHNSYYWYMGSSLASAPMGNNDKSFGAYVRCLKD